MAAETAEMKIARCGDSEAGYTLCPSKDPIIWHDTIQIWTQYDKDQNRQSAIYLCSYWVRKHFPALRCMKPGAAPRKVRVIMELID